MLRKRRETKAAHYPSLDLYLSTNRSGTPSRCRSLVCLIAAAAALARFHSIKRSSSFASFPEVQCSVRPNSLPFTQLASLPPDPNAASCDTGRQAGRQANKSNFAKKSSPLSAPLDKHRFNLSPSLASVRVRDRRARRRFPLK